MITAQHNQSLLDIAIQYYGNAQAAVLLAIVNGKPVSYVALVGERLHEIDQTPNQVATYFKSRNIIPATQTEIPQQLFENGLFDSDLFE